MSAGVSASAPTEGGRPISYRRLRKLGRALPRRLSFTREGKMLVLLTLGMGFAAVNSGNNLLYLVFGMLLALIIVSGILSEIALRSIVAVRDVAPPLFAGQPGLVRVDLTNKKRRFTSLSVCCAELIDASQGVEQRRGFVLVLRPGERKPAYIKLTASKRGSIASAGLRISTRFPFGFFEKSRLFPLPARYTAYPLVKATPIRGLLAADQGREEEVAGLGAGDEFYGLRDMRPGDDARDIAWKVSARRDIMVVREYARPATRRVMIEVLNVAPPVGAPGSERRAAVKARVEEALSRAASLATSLIEDGYAVGLATADGGLAPAAGRRALTRIYDMLAALPLRTAGQISGLSPSAEYSTRGVQHIGILTVEQQQAGLRVRADRRVILVGEAATSEEAA